MQVVIEKCCSYALSGCVLPISISLHLPILHSLQQIIHQVVFIDTCLQCIQFTCATQHHNVTSHPVQYITLRCVILKKDVSSLSLQTLDETHSQTSLKLLENQHTDNMYNTNSDIKTRESTSLISSSFNRWKYNSLCN